MWSISQAFKDAIRGEHQQAVKIEFLNSEFEVTSSDGTIDSCFCFDTDKEVADFVSDGNIDVDVDRLIRRTASLTILNPTGKFTPRRSIEIDTDADGKPDDKSLIGYVYLNRYVRIYRGVHLPSKEHLYVPVGTFMIDVADIIVERNMTVVNLTMSDLAKWLSKSVFKSPRKYEDGTFYNAIIKDIVNAAGIKDSMIRRIDKLQDRDEEDKKIKKVLKFERGESRGEKLKELCDKWDIDIYFDPEGMLVTEERKKDINKPSVWNFSSIPGEGDGMLVSITRSLSDDNLYNHLIVVGTKDEKNPIVKKRENNNPKSKTSTQRIGDRVKYVESERIGTNAEAEKVVERLWKRRLSYEETVSLTTICMPALEGNDIISVYDPNNSRIYDKKNNNKGKKYRLKRFNVPLVTSKQEIELMDTVSMDEL